MEELLNNNIDCQLIDSRPIIVIAITVKLTIYLCLIHA